MSCRFCANNRTNPEWELDEDQVSYAMTIGRAGKGHRIMLNKNPYRPLEIEFSQWNENLKTPQWQTVGYYYPKFCPECGRKIDEYDRSRFDNYDY
jgi:hypothetical protein